MPPKVDDKVVLMMLMFKPWICFVEVQYAHLRFEFWFNYFRNALEFYFSFTMPKYCWTLQMNSI
jgi:hypothetical protein